MSKIKREKRSKRKTIRIIVLLLVFVFLICMLSFTNKKVVGDVNGDGKVSSVDVVLVKRHLLGMEDLTKEQEKRADTNKDGTIDIVDLANIQKIILGVD